MSSLFFCKYSAIENTTCAHAWQAWWLRPLNAFYTCIKPTGLMSSRSFVKNVGQISIEVSSYLFCKYS